MSERKLRMLEDRAMRDASRALLRTDKELLKHDMSPRRLAGRLTEGAATGSRKIADTTFDFVEDNRAAIGSGVAAVIALGGLLFYFRDRIFGADAEPDTSAGHSSKD